MLQPRRTKYRKMHKGRNRGSSLETVDFGTFGLRSAGRGWLTANQIESARRVISRAVRRQGRVWIRVFPDKPITRKPLEVRMGKGKGAVERWVALVKPGKILYEMADVPEGLAREAFALASAKLPVDTRFAIRRRS